MGTIGACKRAGIEVEWEGIFRWEEQLAKGWRQWRLSYGEDQLYSSTGADWGWELHRGKWELRLHTETWELWAPDQYQIHSGWGKLANWSLIKGPVRRSSFLIIFQGAPGLSPWTFTLLSLHLCLWWSHLAQRLYISSVSWWLPDFLFKSPSHTSLNSWPIYLSTR